MAERRLLPPAYLLGALVLTVALHWLMPVARWADYPWTLSGCLPLLFGFGLNIVADNALKHQGTTVKPFDKPEVLITSGVYRISRHPMYLGMVLILFGLATLLGTFTPLLIVGIFALLMQKIFINTEEKILEQQFGEAWREYRQQVRPWI